MKLKEKLAKIILVPLENQGFYINWDKVEKCEKIADEFAIEFAEWLGVNNYKKYSNGWANMFTKATPEKELLEQFKNEKGL